MAPDAVIYPRGPEETLAIVKLCAEEGIALIPYGGGSSVVGGINAVSKTLGGAVLTLDTTLMTRIVQIDKVSMTARIEAGIYGPALEEQLQSHGVTLGHYPQSFEYSTLGGWIAARGAGQQSNRYGKAEKWLVSAKLATPKGFWTTEATPASAAGPNLNQLVAGSEGTLGVICEATVKIHDLPERKDYRGYLFKNFAGMRRRGGAAHQPRRNSGGDGAPVGRTRNLFLPDFFLDGFRRAEGKAATRLSENEGLRRRTLPDADRP